ncbi:SA1362 family protein [Bacillus alkalicellulosilyticus]|uniref:SA1362 family protein n=1 Tax=Alkalihalobacterium alkalicellulosilyticum TaxID=1912214 RepID=UPI000995E4AD|nr:SA1362 family protein [Bacillus alkalicellulosilyticus]
MSRLPINPFVAIIIGMALFGLFYSLLFNTTAFLAQIAIFVGLAFLLFFLYKRFIAKQMNFNSHRPTTARMQNIPKATPPARIKASAGKKKVRPLNKKKSEHNFTVIEGKKNKKKNRALF